MPLDSIAGIEIAALRRIMTEAAAASRDLLKAPAGATPLMQADRDIKLGEDRSSEALIVAALQARSPFPILSEEAGWIGDVPAHDAPYWAVDPLDGSFNHHRGVPLCCTSVALCRGLVPLAGAVFDFNRDETYWGGRELGLLLNDRPVAPRPPAADIITTGFPVGGDFSASGIASVVERAQAWKKIRMIGSAALSLAWVASGRFDTYEETGTRWWDVAGGLALVEGAGGRIAVSGGNALDKLAVRADRC